MEETRVIIMSDYIKTKDITFIEFYAMHGKTMLMMYENSNDIKYLNQARQDYRLAKSLQELNSVLPLGSNLAA